jgi:transposase
MISLGAWTTVRYLKAQGLGTRRIAREAGIGRNTVKRALRCHGGLSTDGLRQDPTRGSAQQG